MASVFKRLYVCLNACRRGLHVGCKPLISLNACYLKGPYHSQLFATVSIDANNDIFSMTYAVAEAKTKDSLV